jgi:hypothetical protein
LDLFRLILAVPDGEPVSGTDAVVPSGVHKDIVLLVQNGSVGGGADDFGLVIYRVGLGLDEEQLRLVDEENVAASDDVPA